MRHESDALSRREFAAVIAGTAASLCIPQIGSAEAKRPAGQDSFFFVVGADPQLFWGPLKLWKTASEHINRLKPALLVVCGDLIHEPGNEDQARAYLQAAKTLDRNVPLYNLAGNHDVGSQPTPESLAWYEKRFGKPWYPFTHRACLFVVLESDVLIRPKNAPQSAQRQVGWLKETLRSAGDKRYAHKFVFLHHPLCLKRVDEPNGYFNVHQPLRGQLLKLFHEHGVTAVFSGHYHRNAYVKDGELQLITTSSIGKPLGNDPVGFRIVKVYPHRIEHTYYGYEDLPPKVDL